MAINWSLAKFSCPSWSANTDESAIRSALASLDNFSSSLHWWLGFWTFLVAVGVVLEVAFVVWEYLDELHDFRRGILHAPERPQTVLFVLGLFGAGLVAAGVSGEFWKESQIATVETCIRKGNDALFLLLSKEAGDAAASAKTARIEADAAKGSAEKAQSEAEAADAQAQSVARKATELEGRLASATQKLDRVEEKRAELEKSLRNLAACNAPRVIPAWSIGSPKDASGVRVWSGVNDPLLPFKGWKALIEYVPNDAETLRAASNIAKALSAAAWDVSPPKPSPEKLSDGVEVQGFENSADDFLHDVADPQSETNARHVAGIVVAFLHSYNWEAKLGWQKQEDVNRRIVPRQGIRILVGLYPPVWFVAPPAMRDWAAFNARFQKERDEVEQKAEQARKESDAKILSNLNPQMAEIIRKDFEADEQRQEQERKAEMQIRSSPCQPLASLAPY